MDHRFPLLLPQNQIDARPFAKALTLPAVPSLPYGEWLVAAAFLLMLLG